MNKIQINRDMCCYCGGCVGICPQNALELQETILVLDNDRCTACGTCIKFCPVGALSPSPPSGAADITQ